MLVLIVWWVERVLGNRFRVCKVRYCPTLVWVGLGRLLERVRLLVFGTATFIPQVVLFVCVTAFPLFGGRCDRFTVIATVNHALNCPPIAAAVQSARVTAHPVITDPPPVHTVGI